MVFKNTKNNLHNTLDNSLNLYTKRKKKWLFAALLLCLFLYIINSIYANPVADDFSYAYLSWQRNLFDAWLTEYKTWNGRYTSNLFVLCNPIKYGSIWGYKLFPVLLILLTVLCIFIFIKTLVEKTVNNFDLLLMAMGLTVLYLYQMPILSEGVYWYTASVTYYLGNISFLFFLSLFVSYSQKHFLLNNKYFHLLLLTLLEVVLIGFNEIMMIAVNSFFLVIVLLGDKKNITLFLFVVVILCGLIMYFAPGNSVRENNFHDNHAFFYSFYMSGLQTARFLINWLTSPPLLILSYFYFFLHQTLSKNIILFKNSFYLTPAYSIAILLYIIFIGAFPAYWATGIIGQHRTMNVSYWLFVFFWFINLSVLFNHLAPKLPTIHNKLKATLSLLLICFFLFTRNGHDALMDLLSGKSAQYDQLMAERIRMLKQDKDTIYFKPILNPPKTLYIIDIMPDDAGNWINRCYNLYFKTDKKILLDNN